MGVSGGADTYPARRTGHGGQQGRGTGRRRGRRGRHADTGMSAGSQPHGSRGDRLRETRVGAPDSVCPERAKDGLGAGTRFLPPRSSACPLWPSAPRLGQASSHRAATRSDAESRGVRARGCGGPTLQLTVLAGLAVEAGAAAAGPRRGLTGPVVVYKFTEQVSGVIFFNNFYLFNFGCTGASLLCQLFSHCSKWGILSSCGSWASDCGSSSCGFFRRGAPRRGSAEPRPRGCSGLGEPRPALPSF